MRQYTHKLFIYIALPCEAKPLVEHFKLKKEVAVQPFAVYLNKDICLTVTGVGKSAMAAGVAYTQALFASTEPVIILNLGIAGHQDHPLGSLFLIDKITDADSQRRYYPSLIFTSNFATASLQTVSRPQLTYDQVNLCDMEASAFYETAVRFSSNEYLYCLKIISDNQYAPAENIQAKQVSSLIAGHVSAVECLLARALAEALSATQPESSMFDQLIGQYHFTVNEQMQLKNQLSRWAVVTNSGPLEFEADTLKNAKEVLRCLELKIAETAFYL